MQNSPDPAQSGAECDLEIIHVMLSVPPTAPIDGLLAGKPVTFTTHWQLGNSTSEGDTNTLISSEFYVLDK